jgi:steroid delta-isomerase-like uncharacterized protein
MTNTQWSMEAAVEFVNRWCGAWNARRFDEIAAMMDPDVYYEDPIILPHFEARGRQAVMDWLRSNMAAFTNLHFETTGVFVASDRLRIIWEWHGTATFRATLDPPGIPANGRSFDIRGTDMLVIRTGLITHVRSTWDSLTAFRQLQIGPGASA